MNQNTKVTFFLFKSIFLTAAYLTKVEEGLISFRFFFFSLRIIKLGMQVYTSRIQSEIVNVAVFTPCNFYLYIQTYVVCVCVGIYVSAYMCIHCTWSDILVNLTTMDLSLSVCIFMYTFSYRKNNISMEIILQFLFHFIKKKKILLL